MLVKVNRMWAWVLIPGWRLPLLAPILKAFEISAAVLALQTPNIWLPGALEFFFIESSRLLPRQEGWNEHGGRN